MSEMTRVAMSSSDVGSSTAADQSVPFDISTEAGVLSLLRTIHRGGLKQKEKNELRDILFALPNDEAGRASVISTLSEKGLAVSFGNSFAPSQAAMSAGRAKQNRLGRARTAPRFAPVAASVHSVPPAHQNEAVVPPLQQAPEVQPVSVPVKRISVNQPAAPDAQAPAEATPTQSPVAPVRKADPAERIKEIKRQVNEKVGNPITLIDVDNRVGREYMNALLSAMKATNGGRAEEVDAAMARLESAYIEAIKVAENAPPPETQTDKFVKSTQAADPIPQKITPPEAATTTSSASVPPPEPLPPKPVSGFETSAARELASTPSFIPKEENAAIPVKITVSSATAHSTPAAAVSASSEMPVAESVPQSVPIVNKMSPLSPPVSALASSAAPAASVSPDSSARLMSVAKEEQLQNLMRQNQLENIEQQKQAEEQMRATTDPLQLPEVTAGLKQLLSEWSLFKSSGFFGTGPGGVDHPLYKKMQNLMMAAVIAGRFEGATPQVKQSITDYMNGWRYEEGIVHEHSETFEHYLRRVIRHILDNKANTKKLP